MSLDLTTLWEMLPALYRIRDAGTAARFPLLEPAEDAALRELDRRALAGDALDRAEQERRAALTEKASAGPLRSLVRVIAEQMGQLEEDIEQLLDDSFIETCAPWVVPYIGDLIGHRTTGGTIAAPRAEIANTIGYRRRKGTAAVLAGAATDITGLPAVSVEYFRRLALAQHLNHLRPGLTTAALRRGLDANLLGGPFDTMARSPDLRSMASGRGRPHIPHVGVHLWPLPIATRSFARAVAVDSTRFLFDPLGIDRALLAVPRPSAEAGANPGQRDVPLPLTRRRFAADPAAFYGRARSVLLYRDAAQVPLAEIAVCCLEDVPGGGADWAAGMPGRISIDPELGRIRLPAALPAGVILRTSAAVFGEAPLGAGEFPLAQPAAPAPILRVPAIHATLADALADPALGAGHGTVEITASGRAPGAGAALVLRAAPDGRLDIRAAEGTAPLLQPSAPLILGGAAGGEITLVGLMLVGQPLLVPAMINGVPNRLQRLRLVNCTLVPGLALNRAGQPIAPGQPSLVIETSDTALVMENCITGPLRIAAEAEASLSACILDAQQAAGMAYADLDGAAPGGPLTLLGCTVMGRIETRSARLVSDSLLLGMARSQRKQQGVVRFSWVAPGSALPRRHACLPGDAATAWPPQPMFHDRRFGRPGYLRLHPQTDASIRLGAFDGGEMGAWNAERQALRLEHLRQWLPDYTRFGMTAGVFLENGGATTP